MVLLVAYDLHAPGRSYDAVARLLLTSNSSVHPQGSVWLIDSQYSTGYWRDALKNVGDSNDEFFVVRLNHDWASFNFDSSAASWLNDTQRTW